jgi:hypothetical protein
MRDQWIRLGVCLLLMVILASCGGGNTDGDDQAGDVDPDFQRIDSQIDQSGDVEPPTDAQSSEHNALFSDANESAVEPTAAVDDDLFLGAATESTPDAESETDALFGSDAGE